MVGFIDEHAFFFQLGNNVASSHRCFFFGAYQNQRQGDDFGKTPEAGEWGAAPSESTCGITGS